jgi:hypothetical protein
MKHVRAVGRQGSEEQCTAKEHQAENVCPDVVGRPVVCSDVCGVDFRALIFRVCRKWNQTVLGLFKATLNVARQLRDGTVSRRLENHAGQI